MSNNEGSAPSRGGIGFVGLLTVAFIVLKLTGYISWSWWWVLSPTWISASLVLIFVVISWLIVYFAVHPWQSRRRKRK